MISENDRSLNLGIEGIIGHGYTLDFETYNNGVF